ncbi:hypothetical protein QBC39DRAFT_413907 [Podospora conica]|nr:hypothetical protein QBC39DRAFT_413907 [Schizothecium conicum]
MDAVLRNFALIPCPAGDSCTAANCLWQHKKDEKDESPGPVAAQAPEDGGQDEGGPRKRLKTSSEPLEAGANSLHQGPHSTIAEPISPPPLKHKVPSTTSQPPLPATPAKVNLAPRTKAVVQNPESQNSSLYNTTSEASTSQTGIASASVTGPKRPELGAKSSVSAPTTVGIPSAPPKAKAATRKPETLNPRLLKSSPATHDFRYKAIKMLHENLERLNNEAKKSTSPQDKKIVLSAQELIWMALDMEQKMALDKPAVYSNMIKNQIMTYRRMNYAQWKAEREKILKEREEAQKSTSSGSTPTKADMGPPKEVNTGLTPQQEVEFVTQFLLTPITELAQHGYVPVAPTDKAVSEARDGEEAGGGWEKCDRCQTRFQVFPGRREDGALTSGGKCTYHWGRAFFPEKNPGQVGRPEREYRCCGQPLGESSGCTEGPCHVFKAGAPSRLAALIPFMETPPNPSAPRRAVCFDCEMAYTVRGMELIRLTATSWPDGEELLDVLVHPVGEILDLNSRFSGVWPNDLVNATPWVPGTPTKSRKAAAASDGTAAGKKKMKIVDSPMVARDLLFSLVAPDTPLIGHGLENDLNACRIIHPTLVDTILLFPHKKGLPIRNGLKNLMGHHLNRAIQVDTGEGHDSAEDARAAGELVRLRVQDKWKAMQAAGWRLEGGVFVAPAGKGK